MSRSRLAIWSYLSGILFTGVTLLGLVVTKYLVAWLGVGRFGAVRITADLLGYLTLFEVGFGATLAPLFARSLGRDDEAELEATASGGLRAFLGLFLVSALIGLAMLPAIPWLIPVAPGDRGDLRVAWLIGVVGLTPMVLSPFRALADARQLGYRINLALTGQSLLIFALSLGLAAGGWGIAGQVAAASIATLPLVLFLTRDGLRSHPGLLRRAIATRPDPVVWTTLATLGLPTLAIMLSGRIGLMTDNLIVGKILGPAQAARLILSQRLAVLAQGQLQGVGNACWAALAQLHNAGRRDDFNRRLTELTRLVAVLGVAALGPILAYTRHFVALWVGPGQYLGDGLVAVASVNALLLGLTSLWLWCFSGTGQVRRMLPATMLGAAVNLAASIGLTFALGPIGPLLGTTISLVGINLWYLPLSLRRTFGTPIRPLALAAVGPLVLGAPFAAALYVVASVHSPAGWLGLAFEMAAAGVAYLVLAAFVILGPEERAVWSGRIAGAFGRRG